MQKKTIQKNSFSKKRIPNIQICSKTQKYEHLHNSQDEAYTGRFFNANKFPKHKPISYVKKLSPSDKAEKSLGEGVAEKKLRNQACLVCFFEARGKLSPLKKILRDF
jgi:ribosomal protein L32